MSASITFDRRGVRLFCVIGSLPEESIYSLTADSAHPSHSLNVRVPGDKHERSRIDRKFSFLCLSPTTVRVLALSIQPYGEWSLLILRVTPFLMEP
jgi:hypothetical protein